MVCIFEDSSLRPDSGRVLPAQPGMPDTRNDGQAAPALLRDPMGSWGRTLKKCFPGPFVCTLNKALLRLGCAHGVPVQHSRRGHSRSPHPWGQGRHQGAINTYACPQECPSLGSSIPLEAQCRESHPSTRIALPCREDAIPAWDSGADVPAACPLRLHRSVPRLRIRPPSVLLSSLVPEHGLHLNTSVPAPSSTVLLTPALPPLQPPPHTPPAEQSQAKAAAGQAPTQPRAGQGGSITTALCRKQ